MATSFLSPNTKNLELKQSLFTSHAKESDSSPAEDMVYITKVSISDLNLNESPSKAGSIIKSEIIIQSPENPNIILNSDENKDYLTSSQFNNEPAPNELNINPEIYYELNKRLYMINRAIEYLNNVDEKQNIPFLEAQKKCTELWIDMIKKGHNFDTSKAKFDFTSEILFGINDINRKQKINELIELIKDRDGFLKIMETYIQNLIVSNPTESTVKYMEAIFEEIKLGDHYLKWINEVAENPFMPLPKWGMKSFKYEGLLLTTECLSCHFIPDTNLAFKSNYEFIVSVQGPTGIIATDKIQGNKEERILFKVYNIDEAIKTCFLHIEGFAKIFNQDAPILKFNYTCKLSVLLDAKIYNAHIISKNEKRSFSIQIEKSSVTTSPILNTSGYPKNSVSKDIISLDFNKVIAFPYYDAEKNFEEHIMKDPIYQELLVKINESPSKKISNNVIQIIKVNLRHPLSYEMITMEIPIFENDIRNPSNTYNYKSLAYLKKLIPKLEKRREELSIIKEKSTTEYDKKITCAKDTFAALTYRLKNEKEFLFVYVENLLRQKFKDSQILKLLNDNKNENNIDYKTKMISIRIAIIENEIRRIVNEHYKNISMQKEP